jgi:hypothetical protein
MARRGQKPRQRRKGAGADDGGRRCVRHALNLAADHLRIAKTQLRNHRFQKFDPLPAHLDHLERALGQDGDDDPRQPGPGAKVHPEPIAFPVRPAREREQLRAESTMCRAHTWLWVDAAIRFWFRHFREQQLDKALQPPPCFT